MIRRPQLSRVFCMRALHLFLESLNLYVALTKTGKTLIVQVYQVPLDSELDHVQQERKD